MVLSIRFVRYLLVVAVSFFCIEAKAQLFQFSGTVTAFSNGKIISFATLYLTKSKTGVTSDSLGNFHLSSNYRTDTLVISSVGFKTIRQEISAQTKFPSHHA